jgi:hypothetical protein
MFKSALLTGIAGLSLMSAPVESADSLHGLNPDLEPAINGIVSANGLFPSQAMEEEFSSYLRWTKERGISRLAAFEPIVEGGDADDASLANQRMEDQFREYLTWVEKRGISPFYAFMVSDFD